MHTSWSMLVADHCRCRKTIEHRKTSNLTHQLRQSTIAKATLWADWVTNKRSTRQELYESSTGDHARARQTAGFVQHRGGESQTCCLSSTKSKTEPWEDRGSSLHGPNYFPRWQDFPFKEKKENRMHQPGIEPGSVPWQGTILPLDHWCHLMNCHSRDLY